MADDIVKLDGRRSFAWTKVIVAYKDGRPLKQKEFPDFPFHMIFEKGCRVMLKEDRYRTGAFPLGKTYSQATGKGRA